jgi:dTDP-4-amino-4,6-dideoxygalactose transaminase
VLYWIPAGLRFLKLGETEFPKDFPLKKFSRLQAGFLREWERHLETFNSARRKNARYFIEKLDLKWENDGGIYLRLPFFAENYEIQNAIFSSSLKRGLGISNMYPTPINEIAEIKGEFDGTQFPVAKEISERLLTLPTHPFVTAEDKKRIAAMLDQFTDRRGKRSGISIELLSSKENEPCPIS